MKQYVIHILRLKMRCQLNYAVNRESNVILYTIKLEYALYLRLFLWFKGWGLR
jgi:hypothetical protein